MSIASVGNTYMTTQQLAKELGVGEVTLWRWRRNGTGPRFHRVGPRAIRYSREAVNEWLRQSTDVSLAA